MTHSSLPRYFVSRAAAQGFSQLPAEPLSPAHVVDCFFTGGRHLVEREWLVATDALGNLLALPDESRDQFPETVQAELAFHEICARPAKRLLAAVDFFLFYVQLLEQPAEAPGLNDPVYLYGTLFGPYPAAGAPPPGVEGQLTATRADLLDGLVRGAAHAFCYARPSGDDGPALRCLHLMLPGDREAETRGGSGVVLAYPLLPPQLILNEVANEIVVSQLLYDTLSAFAEDLAREQIDHPLRGKTLPVPSRLALEDQLRAQGYDIRGDAAARKVEAGEGFQGFLASVFGSLMGEELALPPEGAVDDFLGLARLTLDALPGWPSPRAAALRSLVRAAPPEAYRPAARPRPSPPVRIPAASAPAVPPPAPERAATPAAAGRREPPAWMQDFIVAHQRPGAPPPRVTPTAPSPPAAAGPEWMTDFSRQPGAARAGDAAEANPGASPEWMRDFD